MKKVLILISILCFTIIPVNAAEFTPPSAPSYIERYFPDETVSFGSDLWHIVKEIITELAPGVSEALSICAAVIALQLLISAVQCFSGSAQKAVLHSGIIALSILLLSPSKALIATGIETFETITEYHKVLLPVITAALAAQGSTATAAALYAGTVVFSTVLNIMLSKLILPMTYAYLAIGIASVVTDEPLLINIQKFIKWLVTWLLKITIYTFTGYMGVTGVISGTVDAASLKAAKIAISGAVPVIGNIISDASETVLLSAGIVKNSVGVYGALVIITMWLIPFIKIGIHYLLLKITAGISSIYADKRSVAIVEHFSGTMGFILAMIGVVSLLLLISIVCFLKGTN